MFQEEAVIYGKWSIVRSFVKEILMGACCMMIMIKKIKKPNHTFSGNFVLEVIPWSILFLVTKGLKGQLEDLNSAIESPQNIAAERKQTTSESTKQPSDEQAKVRCCVMKCR